MVLRKNTGKPEIHAITPVNLLAAVIVIIAVFGIVRLMSPNPPVLQASMAQYRAIMFGPSPLTRAQREMMAVVVSRTNDCFY